MRYKAVKEPGVPSGKRSGTLVLVCMIGYVECARLIIYLFGWTSSCASAYSAPKGPSCTKEASPDSVPVTTL